MQIDELLKLAKEMGASDLHLKAGARPTLRIDGELAPQEHLPALTAGDLEELLAQAGTEAIRKAFAGELEADFAYQSGAGGRFRINACLQNGTISLACRPVRADIPGIDELGLPGVCRDLVLKPSGLVVVTGPTGCGKSTTLAAMIDHLNRTQPRRVITIEDPAEFIHHDDRCLFSQRELGRDTKSFAAALKHALRQDPDVILVGEMRDLETMTIALTAAETGHLVLTTLHTPGAAQAIDRFVGAFPPYQQDQVRRQLAGTLEGVLYQVLLPRRDGRGRAAAVEVLLATDAVRNLIREGKTHQLPNAVQTGGQHGMQSLNQSLRELYRSGKIAPAEALARSADAEELQQMLGGH